MSKFLIAMPLFAALALTAPAQTWAQTTSEGTSSEETATGAAPVEGADATGDTANPIDDQLSLGEEATEEAGIGQPYTKETVGAWDLRCIRTETGDDPCQMYQLLMDDQGAPVAEFSLFRLPAGGKAEAGATVVVPLETSLQQQLTIQVDDGQARRYPFAFCNPVGCYVRLGMTPQDIASYKRGNAARLSIVPVLAPDQKVELNLSLEGFTASYDKVSTLEQ